MLNVFLTRLTDNGKQTLGVMRVYDGLNKIMECKTLEPAWLDNMRSVSCIPTGKYELRPRQSEKYGWHFMVEGTGERQFILIHKGNFRKDTQGCILVGSEFGDINKDGDTDLVGSKVVMDQLLQTLTKDKAVLKIS